MPGVAEPDYLEFFNRLRSLDRPGALALVERFLRTRDGDIEALYNEILMPALVHAGAEWEADRISVAHEHYISEVTRDLIFRYGPALWARVTPGHDAPVAVTCAAPDERHVLGLLMVGDILRACGFIVHPLGEGAPADAVAAFVAQVGADLLALSVALPEHLPQARELVQQSREARPGLLVLAGGSLFRTRPEAASELGADEVASDLSALRSILPRLLERLKQRPRNRPNGETR